MGHITPSISQSCQLLVLLVFSITESAAVAQTVLLYEKPNHINISAKSITFNELAFLCDILLTQWIVVPFKLINVVAQKDIYIYSLFLING